jgi:parvulin-like peptidyl-prolyl isomerase
MKLGTARARRLVTILGVAVFIAAGACGGGGTPKVAAVVQGAEIPSADIQALLATYLKTQEGRNAQEDPEYNKDEVTRAILSFRIKTTYLEQLAKQMGVANSATDEQRVNSLLAGQVKEGEFKASGFPSREEFLRAERAALLSKVIAEKVFSDAPVSDTALQQLYDQRKKAFQGSWRMTVETAVFRTQEAATEAGNRIRGGEAVDAVAKSLNAYTSGKVDATPLSPFPPAVIDAFGKLKAGEVSEPIQVAADGWDIARVESRQDLPDLTFEDVKKDLIEDLKDQKRQELFSDWLFRKLTGARVKVSGHYGHWDAKTGTVV